MSGRRAAALLALALIAAVAVGLGAFEAFERRIAPRSPVDMVPTIWQTARETPMHQLHVGTKNIACTECHAGADAGHLDFASPAGAASEATCAKCHEKEKRLGHLRSAPHAAAAAPSCLSCHVFGANKKQTTCADCHDATHLATGAPELAHHRSGDAACGTCHSVHREERTVLPDCTTCHATASAQHGRFSATSHPDRIDADASSIASLTDLPPLDPHKVLPGVVCTTCHAPHAGKERARATCEGCHVTQAAARGRAGERPLVTALAARAPHVTPRGPNVAGHDSCLTCHEPHDAKAADAKPCAACHADHRSAATKPGHGSCTGCHRPHAPKEAPSSCSATCHANVQALAADRVAAHADCTSCHDPHDKRGETSPGQACARCHDGQTKSLTHGKAHGKAVACTSCHEPHPSASTERPAKSPALCAACHAEKANAVKTRSGHASCDGCHGAPHAPNAKPSCDGCHAAEQRAAPPGHATCTSCHDAHSGSLGSAARCTTCHQEKAKALHAAATPQGCASCHRPHGPKGVSQPPSCSSCHARPSLGGLHASPSHADCRTCHTSHGPPRADRATCTSSCHADRRSHQPDATSCNGCHLFRR